MENEIEFRWLIHRKPMNRGGFHEIDRKLQYRILTHIPDSDGFPTLTWSKWKSVKEVTITTTKECYLP
jgi:hypothetical protein